LHNWVACDFGGGSANGGITLYNRFQQRHANLNDQEDYWFFEGDCDSWSGTDCDNVHWDLGGGPLSQRAYLIKQYGPITKIYRIDHRPHCGESLPQQRPTPYQRPQ
jgi:hypothetical protein